MSDPKERLYEPEILQENWKDAGIDGSVKIESMEKECAWKIQHLSSKLQSALKERNDALAVVNKCEEALTRGLMFFRSSMDAPHLCEEAITAIQALRREKI